MGKLQNVLANGSVGNLLAERRLKWEVDETHSNRMRQNDDYIYPHHSADASILQSSGVSVRAMHPTLSTTIQRGRAAHSNHSFADDTQALLANFIDDSPVMADFAARLMQLFDAAGRTNSVTESINGLLKSFLNSRQSFQSVGSMQAYLDLFVLWHNTRCCARGKRRGRSPFQIAGIPIASDNWIDLLGF